MKAPDTHSGSFAIPRPFRSIFALIMREMATSYGKSSMGYFWAILEPVGAIVILTVAFSVIMRSPPLGESFPLFYATGMLPFQIYNNVQRQVSGALRYNRHLLFYPRVTYIDAILSRFFLTLVTQLLVAVIIFVGIFLWEGTRQHIDLTSIVLALLIAAFGGLGIGTLNSVLVFLWPSWSQIWGIVTKPLFIASCIFYLYDALPDLAQKILWYNPLVHVIGLARVGFYRTYDGDYIVLAFPLIVSSLTLMIGLLLLHRYARDLINN